MNEHLLHNPAGFSLGFTPITNIAEPTNDTGINFGILKLAPGEERDLTANLESAYLLMSGQATFFYDDKTSTVIRNNYFEDDPSALHFAANQKVRVKAETPVELAVMQTENNQSFDTMLFTSENMLESEKRGKGLLGDTAFRIVRTIFDDRNRPEANLVLGEVINFPGCWSSYPPHHHAQPEIYHYRFSEPQGYGHGELGDDVYKIREFDTLKILDEHDHAQAAAPGYGMYYIWVIRHLAGNRYDVPTFTEDHAWTKEHNANERVWSAK